MGKVIGLGLIWAGIAGLGACQAERIKRRKEECEKIRQFFLCLSFQIRYGRLPLSQALKRAERKEETDPFFQAVRRCENRLERGEEGTAEAIWQEEMEIYLREGILLKERESLLEAGALLGQWDMEEQCRRLEEIIGVWEKFREENEREEKEKGKLYRSLSLCLGTFVVLILC